ncbi:UvrD-helicase domain-containing protein, partial [bacterium]|nr:UvrD-helicase domain-containing protein [bacterium]
MSKDVCWTEQQREAIEERRAELLVSASAGSGKTAVLIERVLRATLADDEREAIPLDRMLIVTFTNAAASELRARLGRELAAEIARRHAQGAPLDPVRRQLALLPRAQISTLHSFCAEVIRRYGYLRGVSYGRLLDEDEADLLRHELAGRMLDRELGGGSSGIRELGLAWGGRDGVGPEDLSTVRSAKGLRGIMLNLHAFRCSLVEPEAWYGKYAGLPPLDPGQFDPGHALVQALCAELKEWANQAIANDRSAAGLIAPAEPDAIVLALIERRRPVLESLDLSKGWDEALACIDQLYQKQDDLSQKPTLLSSYKRDIDDQGLKAVVERLARSLRNEAAEWRQLFGEPWAELARRENRTQELTQTLWRLTVQFDEEYSSYKGERGVLDFDDQQRWALKILAADPVDGRFPRDGSGWIEPSEAARELRARFSAVLVDEYQDINAVQDAIVNLATADAPVGEDGAGRPRFVVGDLKQSIYAFRLAEPELFRETRLRLDGAATNSGRTVALTTNFRSRPKLLGAINHVFQGLMDHALGGEEYDENRLEAGLDYDALFTDLDAKPLPDSAARLHLVDLAGGGAEDSGDGDEEVGKQEAVYLRVAAVLKEIHAEGRMVFDPESGVVRPVAWRDMVVLLRSMLGRIETLKAVFDKAGVPYYAPGRSGFYERPEVADALSLLRVIDNPRQDVALAAVLRGPALGFTPQELLTVARQDDGRSEERAAESPQRRRLCA